MCHFSGDLSESVTYRELSAVVGFSPPLPSGQVRGVATEGRPRASHPSIVLLSKGGGRNGSGAACEGGPWQPGACRIVPGQRLPPRSLCRGPSAASVPPRPAGIWAVDGADGPGPQHGGSEVRPGAGPPGLRVGCAPGEYVLCPAVAVTFTSSEVTGASPLWVSPMLWHPSVPASASSPPRRRPGGQTGTVGCPWRGAWPWRLARRAAPSWPGQPRLPLTLAAPWPGGRGPRCPSEGTAPEQAPERQVYLQQGPCASRVDFASSTKRNCRWPRTSRK